MEGRKLEEKSEGDEGGEVKLDRAWRGMSSCYQRARNTRQIVDPVRRSHTAQTDPLVSLWTKQKRVSSRVSRTHVDGIGHVWGVHECSSVKGQANETSSSSNCYLEKKGKVGLWRFGGRDTVKVGGAVTCRSTSF